VYHDIDILASPTVIGTGYTAVCLYLTTYFATERQRQGKRKNKQNKKPRRRAVTLEH
jgi:hypothetical protein